MVICLNKEKKNLQAIDVEELVLSTLGNATRREILKLIKNNPNITYTDIMKAMKLDTGTLNYHLSKMADFITKNDNKYQLSKLGRIAVDTIDFLHSQALLSKEHVYFLFNNFVLLRLSDIFLALVRPKLAFRKITESKVTNYFPLAFALFALTNLLSAVIIFTSGTNYTLALATNMITFILLVVFLPFLIVKTVETLWQTKKSYLDVVTLLMISYVPNLLYNIFYFVSNSPLLANLKSEIATQLNTLVFLDAPLATWVPLFTSLFLFSWMVYVLFTALRVYFDLSRGQTLIILLFSGFLYFIVEAIILMVILLLSIALSISVP